MMPDRWKAWIDSKVAGHGLCPVQTLYLTAELTSMLLEENVDGDYVECGVFQGAHPAIMGHVLQEFNRPARIHLFDSFEGIPEAGPKDSMQPGIGKKAPDAAGRLVSTGVSVCSLAAVKSNMQRWGIEADRLAYYEGWFQRTIPEAAFTIKRIAFLRLDADLYESTAVALKHLEPRLVDGGILVVDEYDDPGVGARQAVDEYFADRKISWRRREGATNLAWTRK